MAKSRESERTEVGAALARSKKAFIGVGIFSAFINLLMLTGPIYMLQVYDRVLISGSMSTLVVLSIIMGGLYLFMGVLEWIRSRVLIRIGNEIEKDLAGRTFGVWMTQGLYGKIGARNRPLDDLTTVKSFLGGPAPGALFDIPWAPFFIAVIWYLHWTLGVAALIGAIIITIVAVLNEYTTRKTLLKSRQLMMQSRNVAEQSHRQSDAVMAMGMNRHMLARWNQTHDEGAKLHTEGSDRAGGYSATTKAFRMFVQSSILGAGCALAVIGIITPGMMIAGSIIMGRALAPIQMAIGQWKGFVNARGAYERLNTFYNAIPEAKRPLQLPEPTGRLTVTNLFGAPPASKVAVLQNLNFAVSPGQAVAVVGPSASGKSTLARMLVGIWPAARGEVRLDGATYEQWDRDRLGPYIGYLPQDVELFDGTIRQNISRFNPDATDDAIVAAAKSAAVHEMITSFDGGYDAVIGEGGRILSGGQTQRIALARALFGDPKLIVLDEPNANLDTEGDAALARAILQARTRGASVVVMTHRESALSAVDHLLVLQGGRQVEFGPRDEVMEKMKKVREATKTQTKGGQGGVPVTPGGPLRAQAPIVNPAATISKTEPSLKPAPRRPAANFSLSAPRSFGAQPSGGPTKATSKPGSGADSSNSTGKNST